MPEAARHLHVIDGSTGEVLPGGCPMCAAKDDVIAGLERDIRGWASRYAIKCRDSDKKAREHPLWERVEKGYDSWRRECGHPRSMFTTDDFWLAVPYFEKYGDLCDQAIAGAKFDCFKTRRKNGSWKRHDDWTLIFRDRSKFEEFCNRAPRNTSASSGNVVAQVGAAQCDLPAPGTNGLSERAVDA